MIQSGIYLFMMKGPLTQHLNTNILSHRRSTLFQVAQKQHSNISGSLLNDSIVGTYTSDTSPNVVKVVKMIKKLFILFQHMSIYTNNIIPPVGKTSLQLLVPIPQAICSEQIHSLPLPCSKEEHQELSVAGDPYLKQSPGTHIKIARQLHKASSEPCEQRMQENFFSARKKRLYLPSQASNKYFFCRFSYIKQKC